MASTTGSLTGAASVTLTKPAADTVAQAQISGTYGTVSFVLEGSMDGTNYVGLAAQNIASDANVTGTISPADNTTAVYKIRNVEGLVNVRLRATAVGSGTLAVALQSAAYVGLPTQVSVTGGAGSTFAPTGTVTKATDYTVLATDSGTAFDNSGAAGGVNFTMPAVASAKGFFCWVFGLVDAGAVVITCPSGTLIGANNTGRTTYTDAGSGHRIGISRFVYCNGAKYFLLVDLKGLTIGTYA